MPLARVRSAICPSRSAYPGRYWRYSRSVSFEHRGRYASPFDRVQIDLAVPEPTRARLCGAHEIPHDVDQLGALGDGVGRIAKPASRRQNALVERARPIETDVVRADEEQRHLGPQPHDERLEQNQMAERRVPVDSGVVDPHARKLGLEPPSHRVGPRPPVRQEQSFGRAPANRDDGQPAGEISRRVGTAKAERVFRVDRRAVDLVGEAVVEGVDLLDRQDDLVAAHANRHRVVDPQHQFEKERDDDRLNEGELDPPRDASRRQSCICSHCSL